MVEKVELRNRLREEAEGAAPPEGTGAEGAAPPEGTGAEGAAPPEGTGAEGAAPPEGTGAEAAAPPHLAGGSPSSSKAHQTQTASNPVLSGFTEASKCRQG